MSKNIIFMGTPEFAAFILEKLINTKYCPKLVVSQPDKKVGRKQILTPTAVKKVALNHGIEVFQPENIKNDYDRIIDFQPDLIITAAYGQIVPKAVLDAPKYECINVHGSLLPKYRGGAPIHYAVLNGDEKTGITIMEMVEKMDAGDIISQTELEITEYDTVGSIYDKMMQIGSESLITILPKIFNNDYEKVKQDESRVTYSPNISRELEKLDFSMNTKQVYNHIRGLNPWPVAYFICNEKRYKVYGSTYIIECHEKKVGEIVAIDQSGIKVACANGFIIINDFQPAGKKRLLVKDYINGKQDLNVGDICD